MSGIIDKERIWDIYQQADYYLGENEGPVSKEDVFYLISVIEQLLEEKSLDNKDG